MANTRKRPWRVTAGSGVVSTFATRVAADSEARRLSFTNCTVTHRERPGHRVLYEYGRGREQVWHQGMQRWVDG